jgi:short-subunit dehydrogenase
MNIENRTAIVTGASSGIGLATARLLSKQGARVALVSRSKDKLEELSKGIPNSIAVTADMAKAFEIKRMVHEVAGRFGRIDILVNDAGVGYDAYVEEMDIDTLHYLFDLNLVGPIVAMQQVIPLMRQQGGGAIVNVSSAVAYMTIPGMSPYACLKSALSLMSLTAREELEADNIIVSAVYPYITQTNFEKNTIRAVPVPESEIEASGPMAADTAEFVAQKIFDVIESGEAQIFSHDMRGRGGPQ